MINNKRIPSFCNELKFYLNETNKKKEKKNKCGINIEIKIDPFATKTRSP